MKAFVVFVVVVVAAVGRETNAASIGSIAQNIHSDRIVLNGNLAAALPNLPKRNDFDLERASIPIGGAVDLYYRYGFFSLSVRVVPRSDPGRWQVREPTNDVFEPSTLGVSSSPGPNSFAHQPFDISLCDDVEELKEAYFRAFTAEGIAQPHKLYAGSWRLPTMAKYLGISVDVLSDDDSSFVLVKLTKNSGTLKAVGENGGLKLSSAGSGAAAGNVRVGDSDSVREFVQNYGTHYLQSVTVGDAIYQVLALTKESMNRLKSSLGRRTAATSLNMDEWNRLYDAHLAPWHVKETGNVKVASGDVRLQSFVDKELRLQAKFGSYPNLIGSLAANPATVGTLEELGAESSNAVIGVHFASLKSFVGNGNVQAREFYDEIVNTNSALWEVNL